MDTFKTFYDNNFPIKSFSIKDKHVGKPYITSGIINSIKHRNKLQRLYAKWPLSYEATFKKYRNMLTAVIRVAKEKYYKSKLTHQSGDIRKTWETINHLMGKNKSKLPSSMEFNDKTISDNSKIAEEFNNYFSNIASKLASEISPPTVPFDSFLPEPVPFSFFLRPTTELEVSNVIKDLKFTSPGYDDINIKVIKECSNEISPFLNFFINRCFSEGCFPKQLQVAKIIPIFKKGERYKHDNYRPISVLPCFSKIIEKIFVVRLTDYFTKFSLFTECQYGFRPKYSTDLAIHKLCQSIYDILDNKCNQINVFCDLSKAFDTISHNILLHKLNTYGIRGKANDFIKSYLSFRKQFTVYNNTCSTYNVINCGVPQGSILGPILFLIYVNDIVRSSDKIKFLLFADDTTIYIQGHNINEITNILNNELINISDWLISNRLTLNVSKTCYMVSCTTNNMPEANVNIKIKENLLNRVNFIKFLGVIIDEKLTWKPHLHYLCNKISQITGVLYKIRDCVTLDCLKLIYMSTAYPHLLYCSAIWGGAFTTLLDGLFIAQKKMIRVMFHRSRYDHTNPLFYEHNLLKVPDIISLQTCIFVYKSIHIYPNNTTFEPLSQNVNTRRPNDLKMPLCRTVHAQRSVRVRGVREWNTLPQETKSLLAVNLFQNII